MNILSSTYNLCLASGCYSDEKEVKSDGRRYNLMQELKMEYDHVVLILTDHSDEDTGDLFIGPDESGVVTAAPVDSVSD